MRIKPIYRLILPTMESNAKITHHTTHKTGRAIKVSTSNKIFYRIDFRNSRSLFVELMAVVGPETSRGATRMESKGNNGIRCTLHNTIIHHWDWFGSHVEANGRGWNENKYKWIEYVTWNGLSCCLSTHPAIKSQMNRLTAGIAKANSIIIIFSFFYLLSFTCFCCCFIPSPFEWIPNPPEQKKILILFIFA